MFPPIVVVAFVGTGSGVAEGCVDGGISDSTVVREFACPSAAPVSFCGLAAIGFVEIAAFLGFTVIVAGAGLKDTRFGSVGMVVAVLE